VPDAALQAHLQRRTTISRSARTCFPAEEVSPHFAIVCWKLGRLRVPKIFVVALRPAQRSGHPARPYTAVCREAEKLGTLSPARKRWNWEIPYSPELVRAFWFGRGADRFLAAQHASSKMVSRISIGGGPFHHAFPRPTAKGVLHDSRRSRRHPPHAALDGKIRTAMDGRLPMSTTAMGTAAIFRRIVAAVSERGRCRRRLPRLSIRARGRGKKLATLTRAMSSTISLHQEK